MTPAAWGRGRCGTRFFMRTCFPVAATLLACSVPAQNVFHCNGIPSAFLDNTPARVGQQLVLHLGSPSAPGGLGVLALAGGVGPVTIPGLGQVGLDVANPFFAALTVFLDAQGNATLTLPLSPSLGNAASPAFCGAALSFEPNQQLSISKTVRIEWADADGWEAVAPLGAARQLHTATALGSGPRDNTTEVLV